MICKIDVPDLRCAECECDLQRCDDCSRRIGELQDDAAVDESIVRAIEHENHPPQDDD